MIYSKLVSIITPLYNAEPYIERTIKSVQAQTYKDWEMLVIDDCSSDEGLRLVQDLAKEDKRIKVLQNEENSGSGITRNKGVEAAKGRYIAFLDADDQWLPHKLETQVSFMQNQDIAFSFAYYQQIDEQGKALKTLNQFPKKVSYKDTLKSNKIGCLTAMYDTHKLGKVYMEPIRKRQDYTLWLKLLKKTDYAYCIPEVLATYTIRNESVSSNKLKLIRYNWKVLHEIEGLSTLKSAYYLSYHILYKVFRG